MEQTDQWDVLVIGAGIGGLTTALWARRLGLSALVLEAAHGPGGQLHTIHYPICDYPGVSAVDGPALAERIHSQVADAGVTIQSDESICALDLTTKCCRTANRTIMATAIVIATGIRPKHLAVPGEDALKHHGLVRRPSEHTGWFANKRVAVIGGGDRAAENALILAEAGANVTLIHRRHELRASPRFRSLLAAHSGVRMRLGCTVEAFLIAESACTVLVTCANTQDRVTVDSVCIYVGNQPNVELLDGVAMLTPEGYLKVDEHGQTSIPGVYAVGDVRTPPCYQSLVTAAGQAMAVAKRLSLLYRH